MILFPAIDLIGGKVVRLERGDRVRCKVYSDNPAAVARHFLGQGAEWVHVVDLSSAFEEDEEARAANDEAIRAICAVEGLSVDVGGGVRSLARIDELRDMGAKRIALGTVLVREPAFAEVVARGFGGLIVADVAARDGEVKVNGWRDGVSRSLDGVVGELRGQGFRHLVFTDIARDGMQTGIDVEAYRRVAGLAGFPVVASGGITSLDDIRALAAAGDDVIEGAIVGRALYEGNFSLADALAAAHGQTGESCAAAPAAGVVTSDVPASARPERSDA
nr:HisA/HisF-related TIM barrel protein [uncultured Parolsenella sp.]